MRMRGDLVPRPCPVGVPSCIIIAGGPGGNNNNQRQTYPIVGCCRGWPGLRWEADPYETDPTLHGPTGAPPTCILTGSYNGKVRPHRVEAETVAHAHTAAVLLPGGGGGAHNEVIGKRKRGHAIMDLLGCVSGTGHRRHHPALALPLADRGKG